MHISGVKRMSRAIVSDRDRVLGVLDQGIVSGTRFLTTVLIGRACAPEELGLYSLGFSVALIVLAVHEALVTRPYTIFNSRINGSERMEYAGSALVHFAILAALSVAAFLVAAVSISAGIGSQRLAPVILILAGAIPFMLLWDFGRRMAFAHLRVDTALALDFGLCAVQLGGLALLASGNGLSAASAHGAVGFACAVVAIPWLWTFRSNFVVVRAQIVPELWRSWSFGKWIVCEQVAAATQAATTYSLIAWVLDSKSVGVFAAALSVIAVTNPVVFGMCNILTPKIANAFASGGISDVRRSALASTLQIVFPMACLCGAIALFGDQLIVLLFGVDFAVAGAILPVLALSFLIRALCIPASIGLVTLGRPDLCFKAVLANLAIITLIAPPAMAKWGLVGASWAWLGGTAVAAAISWIAASNLWSPSSVVATATANEAASP